MRNNPFRGYGVALVTPFLENGEIDYGSLSNLIDFQIENGVDFICALGTTAETPTLEDSEYQEILRFTVNRVNGRVPVMAGCSDNCTARLIRRISSLDLSGVSALLVCVPAYNKPTQEGIYQHLIAAANASPLPVVLYNVPGRTGINMTAQTTIRLANASENIIAIKEASGNLQQIKDIIASAPEGFGVISGDDSLTYDLIGFGAAGVISVIGNVLPKTFGDMVHLAQQGRTLEATELHRKLEPLYGMMFKEGSPCGAKAIMSARGMLSNILRLPLVPVSNEFYNQLINEFDTISK